MAYFKRGKTLPNSVQPSGYESKTYPSASPSNDEEWLTEKLIEASRQLPLRLERLEHENKDLRQQLQR